MMESGKWTDTIYAACCFAGARCKMQRLRHNVSEIEAWPPLQCHHEHDPQEWTPFEKDGKRVYPSTSRIHGAVGFFAGGCGVMVGCQNW